MNDSGIYEPSQSILPSQKKIVEQTDDDESSDDGGDGSSPSENRVDNRTGPEVQTTNPAAAVAQERDVENTQIGEPEKTNNMSSSYVENEIRNCQNQINQAIKALEDLRKVRE